MLSKQINHHGLAKYTSLRGRELGKPVTAMGAGEGERATVRERQLLERPNDEKATYKVFRGRIVFFPEAHTLSPNLQLLAEEEKGTIAFS